MLPNHTTALKLLAPEGQLLFIESHFCQILAESVVFDHNKSQFPPLHQAKSNSSFSFSTQHQPRSFSLCVYYSQSGLLFSFFNQLCLFLILFKVLCFEECQHSTESSFDCFPGTCFGRRSPLSFLAMEGTPKQSGLEPKTTQEESDQPIEDMNRQENLTEASSSTLSAASLLSNPPHTYYFSGRFVDRGDGWPEDITWWKDFLMLDLVNLLKPLEMKNSY